LFISFSIGWQHKKFCYSDRGERKRLNDAIKEPIATIKTLNAKRKDLLTALNEKKTALDVAKKNESAVKEKFRKQSGREVLHLVERVLTNHCISKPYYHGGSTMGKP
jgi:hypothetical protein